MKYKERYTTVDERTIAFDRFCMLHRAAKCANCPLKLKKNCKFSWLELEIEKPKCPFCREPLCEILPHEGEQLECIHCGFRSPNRKTQKEVFDEVDEINLKVLLYHAGGSIND